MTQYSGADFIYIDGAGSKSYRSAADYEAAVSVVLDRIGGTKTGAAVIQEMARTPHILKIIPLNGEFNAYAGAASEQNAVIKGGIVRSGANGRPTLKDQKTQPGFGLGTSSPLWFDANTFIRYCRYGKGNKAGAKPDEVLFHEMVHAARVMHGIKSAQPLRHGYDTEEEFYAILLANLYASETGRGVDLREDHQQFDPLRANRNESFLPTKNRGDFHFTLIDKMAHQQARFSQQLAAISTPFNPVLRYYQLNK
jgi:hypothetical protein